MEKIGAIKNGKVITPLRVIEKGIVIYKGKSISAVGQEDYVKIPREAKVIDASGKIVAPGFVDIHIHGSKGRDTMDSSYEAINELATFIATHGTTAFLPTTISESHKNLLNAITAVKTAMRKRTDGAEILGLNMEGPYINPEKRGAQDPDFIRPPSLKEFSEIWTASNRTIKIMTLAPEVNGAKELIYELQRLRVVASVGHSNATYTEVDDAIKCGIRHVTHTFNEMREFHHREPGVVGAALVHDELTAELIADNIHVHPASMKLLIMAKEPDRVVLITDAIRAAGMPDGKYKLGRQDVVVKNGVCRLESGEIAGSTLTMDKAVRNMVKSVGLPLQTAIKMATINPAKVIGDDRKKGSLEPGKDADILIIDENVNVYMTIVKGKIAYKSELREGYSSTKDNCLEQKSTSLGSVGCSPAGLEI